MLPRDLSTWLDYSTTLSPALIDLNLDRPRPVYERLLAGRKVASHIITVGGTNGKGSTVAFLHGWLQALGKRVGCYTSPHLFHFTERLQVGNVPVSEAAWCRAFEAVEGVREAVPLTAFEFQTLAALWHLQQQSLEVAILEIGLGGRLDAVNLVDSDIAIVTTVALDHCEWLGSTREAVGREKGAIFRPHCPAICGDLDPPESLLLAASQSHLHRYDRDFTVTRTPTGWSWKSATQQWDLPLPKRLLGHFQLHNAAGALMALTQLPLSLTQLSLERGLMEAHLPGRFQVVTHLVRGQECEWIFDVAHNPAGGSALALALQQRPCRGRTWALFGMLADKNAADFAVQLAPAIDQFWLGGLDGPRGRSAAALQQGLNGLALPVAGLSDDVQCACDAIWPHIQVGDRIVVTGSFAIVAQLWAALETHRG